MRKKRGLVNRISQWYSKHKYAKDRDDTMTLRKKIILSNILMVLIPTVITVSVIVFCMQTSMGSYWHTLETMYKDENNLQSAQSLIYTYKKELWDTDWESAVFDHNETMNLLERKLAEQGYYIQIKMNGKEVYSNISEADMEAAFSVAGSALSTAKMLTASKGSVSVIKYTFYRDADTCSIIAVNNAHAACQAKSYFQAYILKYVIIFSLLFFGMVLLVNVVLSYWISSSVLEPLKKLSAGAREIRDGNLDAVITYKKNDEFGQVCHDFNEMCQYLKQSVEQRLEYEKRRKELISGISHDLRTPLTSISGYLDGLIEGIASTPEMQKRYLNAMKIRTMDLKRLVGNLSEYNRLESENFHYNFVKESLKNFIEQYLEAERGELGKRNVKIQFTCEQDCQIWMDEIELKRVFDNLMTNTIRYREKDSSLVEIKIGQTEDKKQAWLEFSDDGPGVPEDSLERIFESFYRVDASRTRSDEGSGMGLAVVMEIIKGHGGSIRAVNRNGLTFWITIPLEKEMQNG